MIAILGIYSYISPYIAIYRFKLAIDTRNDLLANKFINYPSVRNSLETQVRNEALQRLENKIHGDDYSYIKLMLMDPLVKSLSRIIVEATVNPKGLKILFDKGNFSSANQAKRDSSEIDQRKRINNKSLKTKLQIKPQDSNKINLYYSNINTFILTSNIPENQKEVTTLWKRHNLFHWLLSEVLIKDKK